MTIIPAVSRKKRPTKAEIEKVLLSLYDMGEKVAASFWQIRMNLEYGFNIEVIPKPERKKGK